MINNEILGSSRFLCCSLILAVVMTGFPANALRMTVMPAELQTNVAGPQLRTISLKLPLEQPVFHWTFHSREELLAGRLVLRIHRKGDMREIVIFEKGKMQEGWESLDFANPDGGEIYFGFQSSVKYETAPDDTLEIELVVHQDLDGIGSMETGKLPAGTYKAHGSYSGLFDGYKVSDELKELPEETIDKLRKIYEYKAFLENWATQWPLEITGDEGWHPPEKRARMKKMLNQLSATDADEARQHIEH